MITRIQALNYRCLRHVDKSLGSFHILVGPNATGKTTFLDVVRFLEQMVSDGLDAAVQARTNNPQDLTWLRKQDGFELAIEVQFPEELRKKLANPDHDRVRYEVGIGMDVDDEGIGIISERVLLRRAEIKDEPQRDLFPEMIEPPRTILSRTGLSKKKQTLVISKVKGGNDNYIAETVKGYNPSFRQSPKRSALGNLPADKSSFPVSTWLKSFLTEGVQQYILNSLLMREASPPGQGKRFKPDGSNLPWVVQLLADKAPDRMNDWLEHLRTALPDLESLRTIERPDDKHRYLMLKYKGGLEIPSWVASDGTLRLLALTIPAYLTDFNGIYLIEEPENGIHPKAIATAYQSLSSVYDAQILVATHSPVFLSQVDAKEASRVLCFAKTKEGATDIVSGDKHPGLKNWQGDPNLYVLFANGVLG